jgi:hydrogenase maturation protease
MSGETKTVRIIGVGSPFSGDDFGLLAVELLRKESLLSSLPLMMEFHALDRPGSGLIEYFRGAEAVVLIDAMLSGRAEVVVRRLERGDLSVRAAMPSSHGLGVAEAVALAEALGELPQSLLIYGIGAGNGADPADWYPELAALLQRDLAGLPGGTD